MPSDSVPARPRLALRLGVTGHRPNRLCDAQLLLLRAKVREALALVARIAGELQAQPVSAYAQAPPILRIISPLAEGADRLVAQEALALHFELECPLPFGRCEYERDFATEEARCEYRALLARASSVLELDGTRETAAQEREAYEAVGRTMLKQCDLLLAIWNGEESLGSGGTGQVVGEAMLLELPIIWIRSDAPHDVSFGTLGDETYAWSPAPAQVRAQLGKSLPLPLSREPQLLRDYLDESLPRWPSGLLFGVFRRVITLGSGRPAHSSTDAAAIGQEPWPSGPGRPPAPGWVPADVATPHAWQHQAWADRLARHYAGLYRSSFVANYVCAALAVLFAVLGSAPGAGWAIRLELALILLILVITLQSRRRRWHERWLDYRLLAEQLRQLDFVSRLGRVTPSLRVPAHASFGDPRNSWVQWLNRALVREAGMASARLDRDYLEHVRQRLLHQVVEPQARYHAQSAHTYHILNERLHWLATGCFLLSFLGCLLDLGLYAHLPASLASFWQGGSHIGLTVSAVFFPTFGAALAGIQSQGEFHRIARRSEAMVERLREIARRLARPDDPWSSATLGAVAEGVAEIMTAELLDWQFIFHGKPLTLP
ncbi:MAG TPA: DUF4231 domain-containing protein [Gemmatimonadales bacterium]|nr:DUF4231 domain-containing protein [Gemmatimonadales bacterium]